ncbi:hypothetical protein GCM10012287_47470 [Streptomyces daqingensis]|uniref:Uncharacterized protein n=1 Tax=Streptomyces daqingensis TaxID=1472640 RepID=A0ABQ2MPL4_9ACTN|nr:hypothetical protein GCM10012287_47470 [Streptomyces daqingensis]
MGRRDGQTERELSRQAFVGDTAHAVRTEESSHLWFLRVRVEYEHQAGWREPGPYASCMNAARRADAEPAHGRPAAVRSRVLPEASGPPGPSGPSKVSAACPSTALPRTTARARTPQPDCASSS